MAFRMQLARSQLEVDLLPTFDSATQLQKVLKGELQVLAKAEGEDPKTREDRRIKALKTEEETRKTFKGGEKGGKGEKGGGKGKGKKPRRFFSTKEGCAHGQKNCMLEHERFDLAVEKDRCILCGAKGHKASECTRPKKPKSEQSSPNGNKGSGETVQTRGMEMEQIRVQIQAQEEWKFHRCQVQVQLVKKQRKKKGR